MPTQPRPVIGAQALLNENRKQPIVRSLALGTACLFVAINILGYAYNETVAAGSATSFLLSVEGKTDEISVTANQAFSLTVKALDNDLATADGYTGTIAITTTDTQAQVPANYTFTATDRGQKTFNLAITLVTAGEQTVTVTDSTNPAITGEVAITVSAGTVGTGTTNGAGKPSIITPTNDSTVNRSQIDVTGTTLADVQVSIYDGERLLTTVNADRNGNFSYTTDSLTDGTHTIKVQVTNTSGQTLVSDPVQVRVDTAPPVLQSVTVNPLEVDGAGKVTISISTEPELSSVKAIADQRAITLAPIPAQSGSYSGEFIAPQAPGIYPVNIEVTDKFNNTSKYNAQATIKVKAATTPTPTPTPQPNKNPTVSIEANIQSGKSPLTVKFTSNASDSDGRVASYLWNFGDGTTSTESNPTKVYEKEGNYIVTLTVTDDRGGTATTVLQGRDIAPSGVAVSQSGPEIWIAIIVTLMLSLSIQRKRLFAPVRSK
jgi:hypothetical protein